MQGVNAAGSLLNLPTNCLWHKLLDQLLQVAVRRLTGHDLKHFLPNLPNLTRLSVRCFSYLRWTPLCEADGEETKEVAVRGFNIYMSFDECLPLADEGTKFVGSEIHAMEVCEAVLALDLVNAQLDLAE